ncbi:MAG: TAT-variant-translocated molybdopterin oxidoreductase [Verrucomicrobia bacterium]|nr:TAT-variant-translocated molybdopterin oxidoreductase [Verrucomicrobiota bacterium]
MKRPPPPCPEPETVKYWRSLDQLAETPQFREWVEREFPAGASELRDETTRRHFLKLMGASFLFAGVGFLGAGCRRPEEKIYPFSKQPENYVHGVPQHFATAMPVRGTAIPLLVRSNDGRPTKIEGNPDHPDSNGSTDVFAQASILNLYDPDRAQRYTRDGHDVIKEVAFDFLGTLSTQYAANGGAGLCFLAGRSSSPSRARLQALLAQKMPKARWFVHEPVDFSASRQAASLLVGKPVAPHFKLDAAKVILSLDCDFLGSEEDNYRHQRGFAKNRRLAKKGDPLSRLYAVEALMTQTSMNADHRLRVASSAVVSVAAAVVATALGNEADAQALAKKFPLPADVKPQWISECAKDLLAHKGAALVVAGYRQPLAVHLLAYALNSILQSEGRALVFFEAAPAFPEGDIAELATALNAGQVETLVVLGGNPVFTAPAELDWAATQKKAKTVIRLGYYEDETFASCTWHLPAAHYLESWGDARTSEGTVVPVQPLIQPLFDGLTEIELLARLAGVEQPKSYDVVRETFRTLAGADLFEEKWKKFLHDGFLAGSAAKPAVVTMNKAAGLQELNAVSTPEPPSKDKLEVIFHRDYSVDDGRYTNNGWLQEMPDPVTKLTWDNAVLVSRKTAAELGVKNNQVVEIELGGRKVQGPIWIQPGQADFTLGLALGYGRDRGGRIANFNGGKVGFNAYPLRTADAGYFKVGAKIMATGRTYPLSCPQDHWTMEGRPIIREATLKQFNEMPNFAAGMNMEHPPGPKDAQHNPLPLYPNPLDAQKKSALHQWGMSIDLNACTGCAACVIACQSENNVPIVGKEQVAKGREMHWLRLDRYYTGDPALQKSRDVLVADESQAYEAWIDDPQVVTQPMLCQHCEAAPCESVCPVNATVHDQEGLNVMAYNRCVGTRYCSNNCPFKVRRFNFFDYNKRPLEHLYQGPMATRREDEWDLVKMVKNPDVTVRMRGVMEKCTFCTQRIEQAKIAQKVKAGASGDVVVPDGTIKTACQQACPTEAIVFGNIADPKSRVSQLKAQSRDYTVLDFLNIKPRTTYLAKVRNPNPAMPDYYEMPLSMKEFVEKNGPVEGQEHHHGAEPGRAVKSAEKERH